MEILAVLNWLKFLYGIIGDPLLARLKKVFTKQKILIVGAGGVGKTTMGEFLQGSMSLLNLQTDYAESLKTRIYTMKGGRGPKATIHVVAGQKHRREPTWAEVLQMVKNGKISGVILVNAYGYHSIGLLGLQGEALYTKLKESGQEDQFLNAYLAAKRKEEIDVLKYIAPHIKLRSKKKLWMLSVVAKEDLWFDDYDKAHKHYSSGEYNEEISAIRDSLGANMFRHELVTMSMVMQDFVTGRGETLVKTNQAYDQAKQVQSAQRFFSTLSDLC